MPAATAEKRTRHHANKLLRMGAEITTLSDVLPLAQSAEITSRFSPAPWSEPAPPPFSTITLYTTHHTFSTDKDLERVVFKIVTPTSIIATSPLAQEMSSLLGFWYVLFFPSFFVLLMKI
jgi:hypothetical protein